MEVISNWAELAQKSFINIVQKLSINLIEIAGAILIILLGLVLTKVLVFFFGKILDKTKIDFFSKKLNGSELFGKSKIKIDLKVVILAFVRWVLYLVFLTVAADILNWKIISEEITNLLAYLPRLFSGLALLVIGIYIANFIKIAVNGFLEAISIAGASLISGFSFVVILLIFSLTALNQAGVDISIITNNLILLVAGVVLTLVISVGLGSIEIVKRLLLTHYIGRNFFVGEKITFQGKTGEIKSIGNLAITLTTSEGELIIPIKHFADTISLKTPHQE